MNSESSNVALAIIAVCAIFSPIITTLINLLHNLIMKIYEDNIVVKRKVIDDFIKATNNCITVYDPLGNKDEIEPNVNDLKNYYVVSNKLILYFPKIKNSKKLYKLNNEITTGYGPFILSTLKELLTELSKSIKLK